MAKGADSVYREIAVPRAFRGIVAAGEGRRKSIESGESGTDRSAGGKTPRPLAEPPASPRANSKSDFVSVTLDPLQLTWMHPN
jgi:hypothetical protein